VLFSLINYGECLFPQTESILQSETPAANKSAIANSKRYGSSACFEQVICGRDGRSISPALLATTATFESK
jgi:hypothetical protein